MPQWGLYALVFVVSTGFSIGGIVFAALHDPMDGGRGGAIAVAIAFICLFIRRDFGLLAYKAIVDEIPQLQGEIKTILQRLEDVAVSSESPSDATRELTRRVDGISELIAVNADGQTRQNFAVAVASVAGTLAWGFGDKVALWLHTYIGGS